MPDGFPKFVIKGSKKLFLFRIPKFNNNVVIDPAVNLGGSEGGGDVSGGGDTGVTEEDTTPLIPTTSPGDFAGEKNSASLLPFNLCAVFFFLHMTAMFTVPFNIGN